MLAYVFWHRPKGGVATREYERLLRSFRGEPEPPLEARWLAKPDGQTYAGFLDSLAARSIWQRQLVLGPAPEFCISEPGGTDREPL